MVAQVAGPLRHGRRRCRDEEIFLELDFGSGSDGDDGDGEMEAKRGEESDTICGVAIAVLMIVGDLEEKVQDDPKCWLNER